MYDDILMLLQFEQLYAKLLIDGKKNIALVSGLDYQWKNITTNEYTYFSR